MRRFVADQGLGLAANGLESCPPLRLLGGEKTLKNKSIRRQAAGTENGSDGRSSRDRTQPDSCIDCRRNQPKAWIGNGGCPRVGHERDIRSLLQPRDQLWRFSSL